MPTRGDPIDDRGLFAFVRSLGKVALATALILLAAWLTHVIVCLKAGLWGFLIAGALLFPIAIIHGIGIWLGIF